MGFWNINSLTFISTLSSFLLIIKIPSGPQERLYVPILVFCNFIVKFLKFFTDLSIDEIENLKDENINQLKILLANETTKMLHGEKDAKNSEKTAKATFSETVKLKKIDVI